MNKQLTAMQELISELDLLAISSKEQANEFIDMETSKLCSEAMSFVYTSISEKAKKLLSKEKEQIQQAYHDGFMKSEISYLSHTLPIPQVIECTEQYYQNTYQNN